MTNMEAVSPSRSISTKSIISPRRVKTSESQVQFERHVDVSGLGGMLDQNWLPVDRSGKLLPPQMAWTERAACQVGALEMPGLEWGHRNQTQRSRQHGMKSPRIPVATALAIFPLDGSDAFLAADRT